MDNNIKKAKFELKCLLLNYIHFPNLKFKVTCKTEDTECRYIKTHTGENPSKISNVTLSTFAILPFSHKNNLIDREYFGANSS